jgi:N-acyl-D-amino-acid deacylase
VIFDLDRIHDRATSLYPYTFPFENYPHRFPEGIDYVIVNGELVIEEGQHTSILLGKVLRYKIIHDDVG